MIEDILFNYYPERPYLCEEAKDFLVRIGIEPSCKNGLRLCYYVERRLSMSI